jgi:hypothetical protein
MERIDLSFGDEFTLTDQPTEIALYADPGTEWSLIPPNSPFLEYPRGLRAQIHSGTPEYQIFTIKGKIVRQPTQASIILQKLDSSNKNILETRRILFHFPLISSS